MHLRRKYFGLTCSRTLLMGSVALPLVTSCLSRPLSEVGSETTNFAVEPLPAGIDKIDLLFMIDNSASMADKQAFFARAVPELVERLTEPLCVKLDDEDERLPAAGEDCPEGYKRQFQPVKDIHIGIVSSSLVHYADPNICPQEKDDRAHLLGTLPRGSAVSTSEGLGFLAWDPDGARGGIRDPSVLKDSFTELVIATGESGCGYEASLESWYHFLVDPAPARRAIQPDPGKAFMDFERDAAGNVVVDEAVLAQRRAFLRPDSLVAVIMLTDENDCSVKVPGDAFLGMASTSLPRASAACADDPNDVCCRPCGFGAPAGCPDDTTDTECRKGKYLAAEESHNNLRCFEQKQRFGVDLLYPTARYSVGLSSQQLCPDSPWGDADCECRFAKEQLGITECQPGAPVPNPLFVDATTGAVRDPERVFAAGIVGVPWQDIATDESLAPGSDRLRYLTAKELRELGRWDMIVGDIYRGIRADDPLMHESIEPRSGVHPITAEPLAPTTAAHLAHSINGHERPNAAKSDLQYACIFELLEPEECPAQRPSSGQAPEPCDCTGPDQDQIADPLCQSPSGYGNTQRYAKAYPGLRELDFLKRFGDNSIVGSICPRFAQPAAAGQPEHPDFGYNPAVESIIDRLAEQLGGACLSRQLEPDDEGQVNCKVFEVLPREGAACAPASGASGREEVDPSIRKRVLREMKEQDLCGHEGRPCESLCLYSLQQAEGQMLEDCREGRNVTSGAGFCYVDPDPAPRGQSLGNPALVDNCDATERRMIRLVGAQTPRRNATTLIACLGKAFEPDARDAAAR